MLNLLMIAAVSAAAAGPATVKSGVERWRAGDHPGAVAAWLPFAAQGDPDALFNMGQAYKLGRGVTRDQAIARDYYRKAAAKGHLPAQANLGITLFQAGDKAEAVRWLKTAADRGEARAQYVYGIALYNGDGAPKNTGVAYGYLLRAREAKLAQATTALLTIEPALSAEATTAGQAVAASLASGVGVPVALAVAGAAKPPPVRRADALRPPPIATAAITPPSTATLRNTPPIVSTPRPPVVVGPPKPDAGTQTASVAPPPVATVPPPRAPVATATVAPPRPAPVATPASAPLSTASTTPPRPAPLATASVPPRPAAIDAAPSPAPKAIARAATPTKPPIVIAKPDVPRAKDWRVQLGAFASQKQADAAWTSVRTSQGATIGKVKPIFDASGPVVKVQLGPYASRDAARDVCAKLAFAGRACFVTQG